MSNHTRANTYKCSDLQSVSTLHGWESLQSIEKENNSLHHAVINARKRTALRSRTSYTSVPTLTTVPTQQYSPVPIVLTESTYIHLILSAREETSHFSWGLCCTHVLIPTHTTASDVVPNTVASGEENLEGNDPFHFLNQQSAVLAYYPPFCYCAQYNTQPSKPFS